jgi:SAM-dependent methyltransferase
VNGGYDAGYNTCPCFWGRMPGSLVVSLAERLGRQVDGSSVLDIGCGEGKNAAYLSQRGAKVRAVEISEAAMRNAANEWSALQGIAWERGDARTIPLEDASYDIVLAYGLFHCLRNRDEVLLVIDRLKKATRSGGYHVVCVFNSRYQDRLAEAHSGFEPCLLEHSDYLSAYRSWDLVYELDSNLTETHPNNGVEHTHSLSRLIAQRP